MTRPTSTTTRAPLAIPRRHTSPDQHPYDTVEWGQRDIVQKDWRTQEVIFEQRGVWFPVTWSENAALIVTTKYFRGALGTPERETSLRDVIGRVVGEYTSAGRANGYFASDIDALAFHDELTWLLVHQHFAFNSPVWFNVGTKAPQQVSACFILAVEDSMDSILNWYTEEGMIFKGGSGAGVNLSRIRSSRELLRSSGGTASGPVSFMRGADASAGTIKSGGATRRAAKMVVLDVDHPDIEAFVATKVNEERKIRVLAEAGFDMAGEDGASVQYQNANNSVRVSDEFMRAATTGGKHALRARTTGEVVEEVDAAALLDSIAAAAHACADPGIQYDDTINDWHTCPESGRISASNPCSEYVHLDNSSCNLASINLIKYLNEDGSFDAEGFAATVRLIITAMDISICFADFPTKAIGETTRAYRQLGIGYANLGALLMATGHAYDSDGGRQVAAAITSLMTGEAYAQSARLADAVGPYDGYERNKAAHKRVVQKHDMAAAAAMTDATDPMAVAVHKAANTAWLAADDAATFRNAQVSLLAPTGTIGFLMDCDTTGIEPPFSLVQTKRLAGGGSMQITVGTVPAGLRRLGYTEETIEAITAYVAQKGTVVGAPGIRPEHHAVFACAVGEENYISPMGHVTMMAAVQPFLSGAISKTVNLPPTATVEHVKQVYVSGWELGLKAVAVYVDNSKANQPLSAAHAKPATAAAPAEPEVREVRVGRVRLPRQRKSVTTSFRVGGAEGYLTVGEYADGTPGEVFLKMGKSGSTLAGVLDALSIAVSVGLQHGVPLSTYVAKYTGASFEPAGMTDDPDLRMVKSFIDYVFRRIALDYLPFDDRSALGIYTASERERQLETGQYTPDETAETVHDGQQEVGPALHPAPVTLRPEMTTSAVHDPSAPMCPTDGVSMRRAGSCYVCGTCGTTSGCS